MQNRQQQGYIWRERNSWLLRYRDTVIEDGALTRKQLTHNLGPVKEQHRRLRRPPEEVVEGAREFLAKLSRASRDPAKNVTMRDFVEKTFFPHMETRRNPSTLYTHKGYWRRELLLRCETIRVRDFSTPDAQQLLDNVARANPNMKRRTLFHVKSLLSAILRLAVNQGYHSGPNPVRDADVPHAPGGKDTVAYHLDTVVRMLQILPEPARTAVAVAAFGGLRRGEVEGLVWEAYTGDTLTVARAMWNGRVGEPKTLNSKAPIPVITPLRRILDEHRARSGSPETGAIFRTRNDTPLSLNNLLSDQILPTLERCEQCGKSRAEHNRADHDYSRDHSRPEWHGWHAFRRGVATILHDLGVDDKTIQAILRHSNVAITQQAYIKTLPHQSVDAMKRLEMRVGESSCAIVQ